MSFLWGVATSSHQIEGDNTHNDWWAWEQAGNIRTGEMSGKATDHWTRFAEDLQNAASLGATSYRFSVEWSRLEPQEGKWDTSAFDWYENLLTECEKKGLLPMLTLHHFTLPQWLAEKGGLLHPHFAERFASFVRKIAVQWGSRVPLWCTVNEPMWLVFGGYLAGVLPPAQSNPRSVGLAHRAMLKAHVAAYDILHQVITRREGPWKDHPLSVGFAHNMIDFQPLRSWSLVERLMSTVFDRYYNRSWLDAVTGRRQGFGVRGILPAPKQVWSARGRRTVDFLGINYYMRAYPCWGPQKEHAQFIQFKNLPIGIRFQKSGDTVSDLGWPIHPVGLGRMIRKVARYGLPIYITENGIADAVDDRRPKYLTEHLREVARAKQSGVDLRGYYYWSLLDNFEWIEGFAPRFGLWEVDYQSLNRRPRSSAEIYRQIIERATRGGGLRAEDIPSI